MKARQGASLLRKNLGISCHDQVVLADARHQFLRELVGGFDSLRFQRMDALRESIVD